MKKAKISMVMTMFVFTILFTLLSANSVLAKTKTPAKLSAKDFIYTENDKKVDFLKTSKKHDWAYQFFWWVSDPAYAADRSVEKTSRNVEVGKSTASFIKKKYGEAKKVKVSSKDKFYKIIDNEKVTVDTSTWDSYMEYTYKKDKDSYRLRFYLDKKNKVMAFACLKNLQSMYSYPNKKCEAAVTFLASTGDQAETKAINGKNVYILPDEAKILYKESSLPEEKETVVTWVQQWGKDGVLISEKSFIVLEPGEYDAKKLIEDTYGIDTEKQDDYLYFTMQVCSANEDVSSKYGPKYYYFRFE